MNEARGSAVVEWSETENSEPEDWSELGLVDEGIQWFIDAVDGDANVPVLVARTLHGQLGLHDKLAAGSSLDEVCLEMDDQQANRVDPIVTTIADFWRSVDRVEAAIRWLCDRIVQRGSAPDAVRAALVTYVEYWAELQEAASRLPKRLDG